MSGEANKLHPFPGCECYFNPQRQEKVTGSRVDEKEQSPVIDFSRILIDILTLTLECLDLSLASVGTPTMRIVATPAETRNPVAYLYLNS